MAAPQQSRELGLIRGQASLELLLPYDRERLHQDGQRYPCRLPPVQDRFNDVGREQREPQDAADVGSVDLLRRGDFLDGRERAAFWSLVDDRFRRTRT